MGSMWFQQDAFWIENVGSTFQREMGHAFKDMIGRYMVDYWDDLIVHSMFRNLHLKQLREVFIRFRMLRMSLNPKKCLCVVSKGRLLGHIVNRKGIYIDPKRIQDINELIPPIDRKGVQSLSRKINFVRRFIPDHASIVKPITLFLRKDQSFGWITEVQTTFEIIKAAIVSSTVMVSPHFDNNFIMYTFFFRIYYRSYSYIKK